MALDEQFQHVALPKLYGAPAYGRPRARVEHAPRPFDPDELPLEAEQTDEERRLLESLPASAFAPGGSGMLAEAGGGQPRLEPRPFRLRALAGRLLNRAS